VLAEAVARWNDRPRTAGLFVGAREDAGLGTLRLFERIAAVSALSQKIVFFIACLLTTAASANCSPDDFPVTLTRFEWINACTDTACPVLKAEGEIENRCDLALGARVKLKALDAAGETVVVSQLWPFGSRNIPPGRHVISFDQWIGHDPAIASFAVEITELRFWR